MKTNFFLIFSINRTKKCKYCITNYHFQFLFQTNERNQNSATHDNFCHFDDLNSFLLNTELILCLFQNLASLLYHRRIAKTQSDLDWLDGFFGCFLFLFFTFFRARKRYRRFLTCVRMISSFNQVRIDPLQRNHDFVSACLLCHRSGC